MSLTASATVTRKASGDASNTRPQPPQSVDGHATSGPHKGKDSHLWCLALDIDTGAMGTGNKCVTTRPGRDGGTATDMRTAMVDVAASANADAASPFTPQ